MKLEKITSQNRRTMKYLIPVIFILIINMGQVPAAAFSEHNNTTAVLSSPEDPYYILALEISRIEKIPLCKTIDEAIRHNPRFLLWVISPSRLSDSVLGKYMRSLHKKGAAISTGIITGSTLEYAGKSWQRRDLTRDDHR